VPRYHGFRCARVRGLRSTRGYNPRPRRGRQRCCPARRKPLTHHAASWRVNPIPGLLQRLVRRLSHPTPASSVGPPR